MIIKMSSIKLNIVITVNKIIKGSYRLQVLHCFQLPFLLIKDAHDLQGNGGHMRALPPVELRLLWKVVVNSKPDEQNWHVMKYHGTRHEMKSFSQLQPWPAPPELLQEPAFNVANLEIPGRVGKVSKRNQSKGNAKTYDKEMFNSFL